MSAVDLARLVKPLKFADETGDGVLTSRETGSLFRVFPQNDGMFFAPRLGMDDGVSSDPQALIDCINKHHAARVISALDADLLAELVGALAEAKVDIGTYVDQDYPPNTCAQYPDVARRHFRDMELCRRIDAILAKLEDKP